MQFFWQFPERTDRLALISSGGLGPEVSPMLRSAALPGASALLWAVAHPGWWTAWPGGHAHRAARLGPGSMPGRYRGRCGRCRGRARARRSSRRCAR